MLFYYLIHASAASGAFPLHRLALIFHRYLLGVLHLFLFFTLYAISYFCHYSHPPLMFVRIVLKFKQIIHYNQLKVKGPAHKMAIAAYKAPASICTALPSQARDT